MRTQVGDSTVKAERKAAIRPLVLTGFVQVYFVAINTIFLASANYIGVLIASFLISLVWTLNVRRVAFGNWAERLAYAGGACLGSVCGLATTQIIQ